MGRGPGARGLFILYLLDSRQMLECKQPLPLVTLQTTAKPEGGWVTCPEPSAAQDGRLNKRGSVHTTRRRQPEGGGQLRTAGRLRAWCLDGNNNSRGVPLPWGPRSSQIQRQKREHRLLGSGGWGLVFHGAGFLLGMMDKFWADSRAGHTAF